MHKITQNWNYQIETETCSRQRRLVVFTIFTFSKLAVERETVSIRGAGKVLKLPVESFFKGLGCIHYLLFWHAIFSSERASFDGVIELVTNDHSTMGIQAHVAEQERVLLGHNVRCPWSSTWAPLPPGWSFGGWRGWDQIGAASQGKFPSCITNQTVWGSNRNTPIHFWHTAVVFPQICLKTNIEEGWEKKMVSIWIFRINIRLGYFKVVTGHSVLIAYGHCRESRLNYSRSKW